MSLTAKDVSAILQVLEDSSFDELSLEMDGVKLTLRRGEGSAESAPADAPSTASRSPSPVARGRNKAPTPPRPAGEVARRTGGGATAPADPDAIDVPSPMLGVFYRAPKPGEPPFVEVGAAVEEDTIIGIIEVMKLMNTVRAGVRGEVVDILAENGALVEFDETLLRVRKAA
jgi:acetyl-CoA carboxylase biotin carboxyl carrier protein